MNYLKPSLFISIVVLIATWLLGRGSTPHWRHGVSFLLSTLFWMSAALSVAFTAILLFGKKQRSIDATHPTSFKPGNRRQSFRVEYPIDLRPVLIIEKSDTMTRRRLEYPVVDLSEDGIHFIDDGSLGEVSELTGQLRFHNGVLRSIAGRVVRRMDQHMCLCLQQGLAWSTLLEEQRVVIRHLNGTTE